MDYANETNNILISLDIMWKGMLGIFVVMIVIIICMKIITKIFSKKEKIGNLDTPNNPDTTGNSK